MASASCWHLYCNSSSGSSTCFKFHHLYIITYQCQNLYCNLKIFSMASFSKYFTQNFTYPFFKTYNNKCIRKLKVHLDLFYYQHTIYNYCNCNLFYSLDRVLPQDVLISLHLFSLLISVILMLVLEIWLKYLFLLLFFHLLLSLKFQKPLNDKKK